MYTLKEFFNKFGTKTSTNIELLNWGKRLGIKKLYYAMRDEIKDLPKGEINILTNLHLSNQSGVHHSAFYKGKKGIYFFDSYGLKPTLEIINLGDGEYQNFKLQKDNTSYCGQLALYFLYLMNKTNLSYKEIIIQIKKEIDKI